MNRSQLMLLWIQGSPREEQFSSRCPWMWWWLIWFDQHSQVNRTRSSQTVQEDGSLLMYSAQAESRDRLFPLTTELPSLIGVLQELVGVLVPQLGGVDCLGWDLMRGGCNHDILDLLMIVACCCLGWLTKDRSRWMRGTCCLMLLHIKGGRRQCWWVRGSWHGNLCRGGSIISCAKNER